MLASGGTCVFVLLGSGLSEPRYHNAWLDRAMPCPHTTPPLLGPWPRPGPPFPRPAPAPVRGLHPMPGPDVLHAPAAEHKGRVGVGVDAHLSRRADEGGGGRGGGPSVMSGWVGVGGVEPSATAPFPPCGHRSRCAAGVGELQPLCAGSPAESLPQAPQAPRCAALGAAAHTRVHTHAHLGTQHTVVVREHHPLPYAGLAAPPPHTRPRPAPPPHREGPGPSSTMNSMSCTAFAVRFTYRQRFPVQRAVCGALGLARRHKAGQASQRLAVHDAVGVEHDVRQQVEAAGAGAEGQQGGRGGARAGAGCPHVCRAWDRLCGKA